MVDWVTGGEGLPPLLVPGTNVNGHSRSHSGEGKYLLLVSGLNIGTVPTHSTGGDPLLSNQLLVDYVCGRGGDLNDVSLARRVCRFDAIIFAMTFHVCLRVLTCS